MFRCGGKFVNCNRVEGTYYQEPPASDDPVLPGQADTTTQDDSLIRVYRGDTFCLRVTVLDELGETVDLTNSLIRITFKREQWCENYVFQARSDQGQEITFVNAEEGVFDLLVRYKDTSEWEVGWPYWFDVEITKNPNSEDAFRQTVLKKRIEILQDITV